MLKIKRMADFIVHKKIRLNATKAEVWDALTNPEKTKQFFFNCEVFSDWKSASPITFKGKMFFFFPIEMKGVITEIIPEQLLRYTLKNKNGSTSEVTDTITMEGHISVLTISDDVGAGDGAKERYDRSVKGWDKILKGLKQLVEKR